jgi:hypothetical protein
VDIRSRGRGFSWEKPVVDVLDGRGHSLDGEAGFDFGAGVFSNARGEFGVGEQRRCAFDEKRSISRGNKKTFLTIADPATWADAINRLDAVHDA